MKVPLTRKVEGFIVKEKTVSQLVSEMGKTAFQGRKLAETVDLWETMVKEDDLMIVLGLAGSMSTAGQWTLINWPFDTSYTTFRTTQGHFDFFISPWSETLSKKRVPL